MGRDRLGLVSTADETGFAALSRENKRGLWRATLLGQIGAAPQMAVEVVRIGWLCG